MSDKNELTVLVLRSKTESAGAFELFFDIEVLAPILCLGTQRFSPVHGTAIICKTGQQNDKLAVPAVLLHPHQARFLVGDRTVAVVDESVLSVCGFSPDQSEENAIFI